MLGKVERLVYAQQGVNYEVQVPAGKSPSFINYE
jgi:hypothetical protein